MGSRLFQYYNERILEHTTNQDAGATVSDSVKAVEKYGLCLETNWTYNINNFAVKPPTSCYSEGLKHKVTAAVNIQQNLVTMQTELANGFPFVLGFVVYSSFESPQATKTGIIPMPGPHDYVLGGHCVVVVGYNQNYWICRNSWGTSWGNHGYFKIPLAYFLDPNLTSDIWSLTKDTN
jgi:hypothetical protein